MGLFPELKILEKHDLHFFGCCISGNTFSWNLTALRAFIPPHHLPFIIFSIHLPLPHPFVYLQNPFSNFEKLDLLQHLLNVIILIRILKRQY